MLSHVRTDRTDLIRLDVTTRNIWAAKSSPRRIRHKLTSFVLGKL